MSAGGWFSTTGRDATVLLRMKEDYDGAEPTASAVSVMNLLTLSHLESESKDVEAGPSASRRRSAISDRASSRRAGPCR